MESRAGPDARVDDERGQLGAVDRVPDKPGGAASKSGTGAKSKQAPKAEDLAMAQMFFKGFRVQMAVEVEGKLIRSSEYAYVEGQHRDPARSRHGEVVRRSGRPGRPRQCPSPTGVSDRGACRPGPESGVTGIKINDPKVTIEFR